MHIFTWKNLIMDNMFMKTIVYGKHKRVSVSCWWTGNGLKNRKSKWQVTNRWIETLLNGYHSSISSKNLWINQQTMHSGVQPLRLAFFLRKSNVKVIFIIFKVISGLWGTKTTKYPWGTPPWGMVDRYI